LGIACDYLVPRGLDHSWREFSLAERYYIRALDIELLVWQGYWRLRERFISLLEWLAQLGKAAGTEEWHTDSEAARFLLGRLRNDHA
jgi:hypothetical protein